MMGLELRFHPHDGELAPVDAATLEPQDIGYECDGSVTLDGVTYDAKTIYYAFAENLATGCLGTLAPRCRALGFHAWDVECVTLLSRDDVLEKVYFAAHGQGQGTLVDALSCEFNDDRLVVYIARGSHASYPSPGTRRRAFGLLSDACSAGGRRVFVDRFGPAGDLAPRDGGRRRDVYAVPRRSATALERMLLPFTDRRLRAL